MDAKEDSGELRGRQWCVGTTIAEPGLVGGEVGSYRGPLGDSPGSPAGKIPTTAALPKDFCRPSFTDRATGLQCAICPGCSSAAQGVGDAIDGPITGGS
jgi:hypothetical protein